MNSHIVKKIQFLLVKLDQNVKQEAFLRQRPLCHLENNEIVRGALKPKP